MMRARPSCALSVLLLSCRAFAQPRPILNRGYALADDRVVLSAAPGPQANYAVSFSLLNHGVTVDTPMPEDWDGVHVALRYADDCRTYYASVNRRDNKVVIKKRVPDGRSTCGSFYNLSGYAAYDVPYGEWQKIRATVSTRRDGSVLIEVFINGRLAARGVDEGQGGPPILGPGEVILRADAAALEYDDFAIESIPGAGREPPLAFSRPITQPTEEPPSP